MNTRIDQALQFISDVKQVLKIAVKERVLLTNSNFQLKKKIFKILSVSTRILDFLFQSMEP